MKKSVYLFLVIIALLSVSPIKSQTKAKNSIQIEGYQITNKIEIPTTPVKDQGSSGTCWSYATTSFIETELIRLGKGEYDLSEMFFVRYAYPQKAGKYIRYQGFANFGEGGQGHDVFNVIRYYGLAPEVAYLGLNPDAIEHDHGELLKTMTGILDNALEDKDNYKGKSLELIEASLDLYLGKIPEKFTYNGVEYTPNSFSKDLGLNTNDYIEFTSYSSYPFYKKIDLEIPDNWSHDSYFNVPIDELMSVINYAFENGYSVNWDGDVSEKGFTHKKGLAIVPEHNPNEMEASERVKWESLTNEEKQKALYDYSSPIKEMKINQETRQKTFDNFKTTDDHLMHLVGTATDQNGNIYYITKNSWAQDSNNYGGKLYMSESYVRLKTVAIQVHKDAIPPSLKTKLNMN